MPVEPGPEPIEDAADRPVTSAEGDLDDFDDLDDDLVIPLEPARNGW